MAHALRTDSTESAAARVMDEAIELAIQERSPYPEKSLFIDAYEPDIGSEIRMAAGEGRAVVLVDPDGTTCTLLPERAHR
jgi:hypothetical protein